MFFKLSVALAAVVALFTTSASAVDALGFASTVECRGASFSCPNLALDTCCGFFPTGFGFSVAFTNMVAGTQGQFFRNSSQGACIPNALIGNLFGPGTKCFNSGGLDRALSVQLINSPSVAKRADASECVAPTHFSFVDGSGKEQKIKFAKGQADRVASLFRNSAWADLAKFEKVRNVVDLI